MGNEHLSSELVLSLLQSGWSIRLPVSGWSMKPLIPPGSVLRIAPSREPLRIGDIVVFPTEQGKLVSHRILALTGEAVRTKGDACVHPDAVRERARIVGRVVGVETPFPLFLDGWLARALGRMVGWVFPRLVQLKMTLMEAGSSRGVPDA